MKIVCGDRFMAEVEKEGLFSFVPIDEPVVVQQTALVDNSDTDLSGVSSVRTVPATNGLPQIYITCKPNLR